MEWTGNIARTAGQVILAVGIIAVVLGIAGLVIGGLIVKDATSDPQLRNSDVGDILEFLIVGGLAFTVGGTLAVVGGLVVLGVARSLRERLQRRLGTSATPPAAANDA